MVIRHPLAHRRRHQEHLITISPNKPRTHPEMIPTRPDELPDSLDELRHDSHDRSAAKGASWIVVGSAGVSPAMLWRRKGNDGNDGGDRGTRARRTSGV